MTKKNGNGAATEAEVETLNRGSKRGSWSDDAGRAEKSAEHLEAMASPPPPVVNKPIILPTLDILTMRLKLVGDAPLITNRWSEKAKKMMRDKQTGEPSAGKENKVPENDFRASLYDHPEGGYGFPTIAFKNAAVSACTSLGKSVTKVAARQAFHVIGELARIEGEPEMREDMVRVGQGTADIRYRAMFPQWSVVLTIRYNSRLLSAAQVMNLFNTAGFAVGVGEWRPECNGSFGLFHVA